MPKITKLLCISFYFVLHVIYVAAMRFFKQDHNGHVIVSLMLLKSSLISFFESYMKQKIPKIMKTSSIMMNWYSLHIIYTQKTYISKVKKIYIYIMCNHALYSVIFRDFFVALSITRLYLGLTATSQSIF